MCIISYKHVLLASNSVPLEVQILCGNRLNVLKVTAGMKTCRRNTRKMGHFISLSKERGSLEKKKVVWLNVTVTCIIC